MNCKPQPEDGSDQTVDCVVRFHDARRLGELERCLFSLLGQRHRPLVVHVMLQRFTAAQVAAVNSALAPLRRFPGAAEIDVCNWEEPGDADARTALLNAGLRRAMGRYVGFLDYDDVLFPEAYELLVARLRTSGAAIAFGSVQEMEVELRGDIPRIRGKKTPNYAGQSLADLFVANFCPIHSYLIDRRLVDPAILVFDETLAIEEDYDLLLRLCAAYPSDFKLLGTQLGYYFYKTDGSNTVAGQRGLEGDRLAQYRTVQARIRQRKATTQVAPDVQSALGVRLPIRGASILDVQTRSRSPVGLAARLRAWAAARLDRI